MTASTWASVVTRTEFWRARHELDAQVMAEVPRYSAAVHELVDGVKVDAEALYLEHSSSARAGSVVRRSGLKIFAALLSDLAPIIAFALFYSRAALDVGGALPWSGFLLLLGAGASALALLPIRSAIPPTGGMVFHAWIPVVLGALALAGAQARAGAGDLDSLWLGLNFAGVALSFALAAAATIVRLRNPQAAKAHEAEASEWKSALESSYDKFVADRARRIEQLFDSLSEEERGLLLRTRDAAVAELAGRSVVNSADSAGTHTPGILLLEYCAQRFAPTVALGKRVNLVPDLRA